MEIEKESPTFLANVEVMLILQKLKEDTLKKHKREGALATITYETLHYLQNTDSKTQSGEDIENFLKAIMKFNLSKMEKLMMVNSPPRNELDIQLIVHESEERLSEDNVQTILEIVKEHLLKNSGSNEAFIPNKTNVRADGLQSLLFRLISFIKNTYYIIQRLRSVPMNKIKF